MAESGIKIEGLKEMYSFLDGLPAKYKGSILRRANRKMANIAKKALKTAIQQKGYTNKIKASDVIVKNDKYNISGVLAGLSTDSYIARFIEDGTKQRFVRTRSGVTLANPANRGTIAAKPFLVPALQGVESEIQNKLESEYTNLIFKSLQQQNKLLQRRISKAR